MLPIGGKPIIEHLLENVANVPHAKMTIVASRGFNALRQFVGSGERWGLEIELTSSRPNEPLASFKRRNPGLFGNDAIVLSADRVYTESLSSCEEFKSTSSTSEMTLLEGPSRTVHNHKEYLELNLSAARGDIEVLRLRGRERALGLTTGYMTRIDPRSVRIGQTHAGNHCRVDKSASLSGTVVLDSSVVIDRNSTLEDVVVLEHTYVGEQLNLQRCIVSGRYIIRVDEGVVVELADSFIAAPLQKGVYSAHLSGPINQLFGVLAGVVALPFMAVALVMGLWENPYEPIVTKSWVSNKQPQAGARYRVFDTFEFNVSNRLMRRLPQILDIGLGHLRWFGVSPASATELDSRREPWQMTRDQCAVGVLGAAQLECANHSTLEERLLSDAAYVPTASWQTNLGLVKDAFVRWIYRADKTTETALP